MIPVSQVSVTVSVTVLTVRVRAPKGGATPVTVTASPPGAQSVRTPPNKAPGPPGNSCGDRGASIARTGQPGASPQTASCHSSRSPAHRSINHAGFHTLDSGFCPFEFCPMRKIPTFRVALRDARGRERCCRSNRSNLGRGDSQRSMGGKHGL